MKIEVWKHVSDTDIGTHCRVFGTRQEAEDSYVQAVNGYREETEPPLTDFTEAHEFYENRIMTSVGCIDTQYVEPDTVELPKSSPRRFYVTKTWHDWPEGGSCGEVIEAEDHTEAESKMLDIMAEYYAQEDDDVENIEENYAPHWHTIDCFDLDEAITSWLASRN